MKWNKTSKDSQFPVQKGSNSPISLKGARVLVVDDSEVDREIVKVILTAVDCDVVGAADGLHALKLLDSQHFDVVLMDCQMPVMDGHQAITKIRKKYPSEQLPVIALTGTEQQQELEICLVEGMNDYIVKPFDVNYLYALISRWLGVRADYVKKHSAPISGMELASSWPRELPGLDVEDGCQRVLGKRHYYLSILKKFDCHLQQWLIDIEKYRQLKDTMVVMQQLHTLGGTARNLGANNCADVATAIERSIAGQLNNCETLWKSLRESITVVRKSIKSLVDLNMPDKVSSHTGISRPKLLEDLLVLVKEHDTEALQQIRLLKEASQEKNKELVEEVELALSQYDFPQAIALLAMLSTEAVNSDV